MSDLEAVFDGRALTKMIQKNRRFFLTAFLLSAAAVGGYLLTVKAPTTMNLTIQLGAVNPIEKDKTFVREPNEFVKELNKPIESGEFAGLSLSYDSLPTAMIPIIRVSISALDSPALHGFVDKVVRPAVERLKSQTLELESRRSKLVEDGHARAKEMAAELAALPKSSGENAFRRALLLEQLQKLEERNFDLSLRGGDKTRVPALLEVKEKPGFTLRRALLIAVQSAIFGLFVGLIAVFFWEKRRA